MSGLKERLVDLAKSWTIRTPQGQLNDNAWFGAELHSLISETSEEKLAEGADKMADDWETEDVPEKHLDDRHVFSTKLRETIKG